MKKGVVGRIIAIVIVIAAVVAGALVMKSNALVKCSDCNGTGYTYTIACGECSQTGLVDGEKCGACEGELVITADGESKALEFLGDRSGTLTHTECEECGGVGKVQAESRYYSTIMAIFPPLVAIALALITKEVYSSLFIGIVLGGFLHTNWNPVETMNTVLKSGIVTPISDMAGILVFLVVLGVMVALVNKAGGSAAFGRWAEKNIKSRVGAMLATFVLGVLIFIDDYFNCLTVGSVMRPVTDRHKISRSKLAYLIDATAAPICMIAPVSSWAAAVSDFAKDTGYSGIELFIKAIPYNFYSLLTLVFVVALVFMKFDYGPMKIHEMNALNNGDLFTVGERTDRLDKNDVNLKGRVIDLLFPILVLVFSCIGSMLYVGGFFSSYDFIDALGNTEAGVALPWGAIIALVITIIYLIARRIVTFKDAMDCIPKGFIAMVPAILILVLATGLKDITKLLGSGDFVQAIMGGAKALQNFLPAIIFVVACVIAFSTGTSWGTFGILIPIVVEIFPDGALLMIGMSACLAGAVCGDHCSPISDTTIMSSAGAQADHLSHVSTQMPYAITVAGISFVMYLIAAFVQNIFILLPLGVLLTVGTLVVIKMLTNKK